MESVARTATSSRKYLNGLAKCVEKNVLSGSNLASWKLAKEKRGQFFKAEFSGSYKVFEQRPIRKEILSYCIGDIQDLPKLWSRYRANTDRWRDLVNKESKKLVEASQEAEYQAHGLDRTLALWSEELSKEVNR